ncbi:hypothetical protein PtA15_12A141 [Puccinia triticina]|uniref:Uncharacterized protein n=1 Tax=Puccinia triticina TaxID=208348 RepID=A0ABY7D2C6_9BASI|nr:uncharacterized protein PtA15_12A141 [Puccinia triticina]WAQ90155.1 hypothetical protein PtA15_12A141 [Puccinia triticina]
MSPSTITKIKWPDHNLLNQLIRPSLPSFMQPWMQREEFSSIFGYSGYSINSDSAI